MRDMRWAVVGTVVLVGLFTGCPAPDGALDTIRIEHDGRLRSYRLFMPEMASSPGPRPVVVALHGFTQTGAGMARMTGFNAVAEREGVIAVYPDGLQRRFNAFGDSEVDDVGFLLAVIDDVSQRAAVDPARVYLMGSSNGAFMAYRMVCEAGDRFAAVAAVMGTMPRGVAEACPDEPSMPVCIVHGTADPVVPYDEATIFAGPGRTLEVLPVPEGVVYWAARNQTGSAFTAEELPDKDPTDGTRTTRYAYGAPGSVGEVVLYAVEGGGHTWPGGATPGLLYAPIVGVQAQDFSASEAIWAFFARHRREVATP